MKPNFALTLSFGGIGLLHRAHPGWHLVGDVALDVEDLSAALAELRNKAKALDPSGLSTKLVIPNDQIKYLSFEAGDANGAALEDEVRQELEDATPYSLDELAYDWSVGAGQVHVAAVAHETLAEAESFANEHDFNPLCFVAMPEDGHFVGEPYFGETKQATELLDKGQSITRDSMAIRILGAATLPTPAVPGSDNAARAEQAVAEPQAKPPALGETKDSSAPKDDRTEEADTGAASEAPPEIATMPAVPDTGEEDNGEDDTAEENKQDTAPASGVAVPQGEPAPVSFTSIRASRDSDTPGAAPRLTGAERDGATSRKPGVPVTGTPAEALTENTAADLAASLTPDPDARLHDAPAATQPEAEAPAAPKGLMARFRARRDQSQAPAAASRPKRKSKGAAATMALSAEEHADETHRMTVFGARDEVKVGGKPRYLGLILTAILLLFLVSVAAWASIFMDDGLARFFRGDETQLATTPDAPGQSGAEQEEEKKEEEKEDPGEVALASLPQDETGSDPQPALSQPAPAELTPDEARARYAATGIWQRAPWALSTPKTTSLNDFYQTSIDSSVPSSDAVALPQVARLSPDVRPPTPASPAAAGTQYTLDDRGLVVATEAGALTPSGVQVFAGAPPLTPGVFPDRPEAVALALPPEELRRLMGVRPKARPDDLVEQNERGQLGLGGRTRTELAVLRPKLRPESAQQAALRARAEAAEKAQEADLLADATPQAVAASLKPNARPRNFDQIVKRSAQAAAAQPVSASQRIKPSAPTVTTVARAATEKNQVNLRKVNLIGVYGKPSNRRALVRLSNGRYKKVQVGDSLDRGRVTAIGDAELRYKKSGRNVVLRLPRG
jgi:hypothetical protein